MTDHAIIAGLGVVGILTSAGGLLVLSLQYRAMRHEIREELRLARRDSRRLAQFLAKIMTGTNGGKA